MQWRHFSSHLRRNGGLSCHIDLVSSYPPHSLGETERRLFCCSVLPTRVPLDPPDRRYLAALLHGTFLQQSWLDQYELQQRNVCGYLQWYLWKKQLNQNSLVFTKLMFICHSVQLTTFVQTLVQVKMRLFRVGKRYNK